MSFSSEHLKRREIWRFLLLAPMEDCLCFLIVNFVDLFLSFALIFVRFQEFFQFVLLLVFITFKFLVWVISFLPRFSFQMYSLKMDLYQTNFPYFM